WATHAQRLDLNDVKVWWAKWGTGSQAHVGPVRASILAQLPLTLRQLGVRESPELSGALSRAEKAQRRREQASGDRLPAAIAAERRTLDELGELIQTPEHQRFLWNRV